MTDLKNYKLPKGKVLVFKSVKNDMTSRNDFKWPDEGEVSAPDWRPEKECGNGLHGWLWGSGDYSLKVKDADAKWLVLEVDTLGIVDLLGKVKFEKCKVIYCGVYVSGFAFIRKQYWASLVVTNEKPESSATGYSGHASATGYSGHASATGDSGHASATGNYGHASATGYYGHASATGYSGHASATGYSGHASATGDNATGACINTDGKARCGKNGSIILTYFDKRANRNKHVVGYEGKEVEANTWYELTATGKLKKCKDQDIVLKK
jgi:hypothetical protein